MEQRKENIEVEWRGGIQEIMDLLHTFHQECLEEPFDDLPLARRRRKKDYAERIYDIVLGHYE